MIKIANIVDRMQKKKNARSNKLITINQQKKNFKNHSTKRPANNLKHKMGTKKIVSDQ